MKKTNSLPYTNDAREGRTAPGLIEVREGFGQELAGTRSAWKYGLGKGRLRKVRFRRHAGNPVSKSAAVRKLHRTGRIRATAEERLNLYLAQIERGYNVKIPQDALNLLIDPTASPVDGEYRERELLGVA